jgi:hypothetical protein
VALTRQLKPLIYETDTLDPNSVAVRHYQEFAISHIVSHEGTPSDNTKMTFLVRWLGYGLEEDTWVDWGALLATEQLHAYLRANNLKRLIPKSYQTVQLRDNETSVAAIVPTVKKDAYMTPPLEVFFNGTDNLVRRQNVLVQSNTK